MAAGDRTVPRRQPSGGTRPAAGRTPPEAPAAPQKYVLRLYVTGMTLRSRQAIANLRKICEGHLASLYELEIVDIYERPTLARDEQIIAAPTLVKVLPLPLRRFIGDLSNTERVLLGLDLRAVKKR